MNFLKEILLFIWQFPQNLLGLFLLLIFKLTDNIKSKRKINKVLVYSVKSLVKNKYKEGLSLGNYVFVEDANTKIVFHEIGHSKQSKILGPFYMIIIGIPSMILASLTKISPTILNNYYKFYPENWADMLGGVER